VLMFLTELIFVTELELVLTVLMFLTELVLTVLIFLTKLVLTVLMFLTGIVFTVPVKTWPTVLVFYCTDICY
jgi:hypothetical protein